MKPDYVIREKTEHVEDMTVETYTPNSIAGVRRVKLPDVVCKCATCGEEVMRVRFMENAECVVCKGKRKTRQAKKNYAIRKLRGEV